MRKNADTHILIPRAWATYDDANHYRIETFSFLRACPKLLIQVIVYVEFNTFRMGAYKTDPDIQRFPRYGQEFKVSSITVHPDYDCDTCSNDVALVKLNGRARKTE